MAAVPLVSFHTGYLISHFSHHHDPDQSHLDCSIDQCQSCDKSCDTSAEVLAPVNHDGFKADIGTLGEHTKYYVPFDEAASPRMGRKRSTSLTDDSLVFEGMEDEVATNFAPQMSSEPTIDMPLEVPHIKRERSLSLGDRSLSLGDDPLPLLGDSNLLPPSFNQRRKSAPAPEAGHSLKNMFERLMSLPCEPRSVQIDEAFHMKYTSSDKDSMMSLTGMMSSLDENAHPSIHDASWHKFRYTWEDNLNEH